MEFRKFQSERAVAGPGAGAKAADLEARLLGKSAKLTKLIAQVKKLAAGRNPVLLVGENGTGKSAVAEVLHLSSGAPENSIVRIDCSLSSETNFRQGLLGQNGEGGDWVRQAKGGMLYLQHLQCLSLPIQKELVSVLRNTAHGFRLVCTTSEDLERLVDEGKFHDELFYRVASLPVHMPPLRERTEDIPILIKQYASQAANPVVDANLIEFTDDAMSVMTAYHWPGNLTELYQVVTKVAATTETRVITSQQLPVRLRELKDWPSLADYLAGQEKQYVDMVIHACRGDKTAAAKVLGIEPGRVELK